MPVGRGLVMMKAVSGGELVNRGGQLKGAAWMLSQRQQFVWNISSAYLAHSVYPVGLC